MNHVLLLMTIICFAVFSSCGQSKEKTFEEQALELIKKVGEENQRDNKIAIENNNFSEGVQEVLEYFEYSEPVVSQYADIKIIKSTSDYESLKDGNPSSVIAIQIVKSDTEVLIEDISIFNNLEYLEINSLDSLPNGFYKLEKLKVFVGKNKLNGKMDHRIENLANLEFLELLFTYLELPAEIENLNKLKTIRMYNFSHNQPYRNIYNIPNLKTLWIRYSNESQLEGISNLRNLRTLVTNKVNPEIGKLNLTGLNINNNNDEIYPKELEQIQSLVAFKWQGNNIRESPPEFVAKLKNLEYLEIRGCSKFTIIPIEFDNLKNLKQFDIICRPEFNGNIDHLKIIKNKINIK